jgi:hypothetical protein
VTADRPREILAMCDAVDRHFIFEVGPFGEFVIGNKSDLDVTGIDPKSRNELHQLSLATDRLRTSVGMVAARLRAQKKTPVA